MKKYIILALLAIMPFICQAQDTVRFDDCKYMCYPRPTISRGIGGGAVLYRDIQAAHYVNTPTQIYGVAVTMPVNNGPYAKVYVVQLNNGIPTILDSTRNLVNTVDYEYIQDVRIEYGSSIDTIYDPQIDYRPSLEFYFDSAITVTDTFFVGVSITPNQNTIQTLYSPSALRWPEGFPNGFSTNFGAEDSNEYRSLGEFAFYSYNMTKGGNWGGIFPIMLPDATPHTDTTGTVGGDTLGIGAATWMAAIEVAPNPASGSAAVTSRSPLRLIEAYDMQGRRLLCQAADGSTAALDLGTLRPGCYILQIHTAAGTAHRKLVIR